MRLTLTVNLSAIRSNYNLLKSTHAKHNIAGVVKANAYGLGMERVSLALWEAGCNEFFVATLEEGIELHEYLPKAKIGVFQGLFAGEEKEYAQHHLSPVLTDLSQIERFTQFASWNEDTQFIIHIDTGMTRLGLCESDLKKIPLTTYHSPLIISHLACANTPEHLKNSEQLQRFRSALSYFPNARASLANSAGVFLPQEFHFDMARTGCALYGINPTDGENPMQNVASLSAPIVQIRALDRDETIGYGATTTAKKGAKIAIVGMGYADGYCRLLGNIGFAYISGYKVPVIGRVSMDLVAIDASKIPENELKIATKAEFINEKQTVDDIALSCNTIGYEIFTSIGGRVKREYI